MTGIDYVSKYMAASAKSVLNVLPYSFFLHQHECLCFPPVFRLLKLFFAGWYIFVVVVGAMRVGLGA